MGPVAQPELPRRPPPPGARPPRAPARGRSGRRPAPRRSAGSLEVAPLSERDARAPRAGSFAARDFEQRGLCHSSTAPCSHARRPTDSPTGRRRNVVQRRRPTGRPGAVRRHAPAAAPARSASTSSHSTAVWRPASNCAISASCTRSSSGSSLASSRPVCWRIRKTRPATPESRGQAHLQGPPEQARDVEGRVHPPELVQPVGVDAGAGAVGVAAVEGVGRRHRAAELGVEVGQVVEGVEVGEGLVDQAHPDRRAAAPPSSGALPVRSPVPSSVPLITAQPAWIAARQFATTRWVSLCGWNSRSSDATPSAAQRPDPARDRPRARRRRRAAGRGPSCRRGGTSAAARARVRADRHRPPRRRGARTPRGARVASSRCRRGRRPASSTARTASR